MAESDDCGQLELEIVKLKEICDCKVIENIGDFAYVIVAYLKDKRITVTFQLTEKYPEVLPEVAVKGAEIDHESLNQLKIRNQNPSLVDFIKFISEKCVDGEGTSQDKSVSPNKNSKCKGKKKRHTCDANAGKKASMKTSEDVVKRVIWDPQLTSSDFTVGYLDRFLGILEKNFTAFNWEAFDTLDESETAIPKHRIQHFKYKDVIVWDKNRRVDNVFGSTGSGLTIIDIIENYVNDTSCATDADNCEEMVDDDEIEIVTSRDEVIKNQRQHRPNYFLCQRITDPQVIAVVEDIQKKMINNDSSFKDFIIPPQSLHLTLCTLGLYTKGDVDLVTEILHDNKEELSYLAASLEIKIKGIDQFFNRVVYSKVLNNEKFLAFVDYLKLILQEKGLNSCDAYEFVPHITLMKVIRENCLKTIPKRLYENLKSTEFGFQKIDELFLCEISKSRDDYGFYICPTKLKL